MRGPSWMKIPGEIAGRMASPGSRVDMTLLATGKPTETRLWLLVTFRTVDSALSFALPVENQPNTCFVHQCRAVGDVLHDAASYQAVESG